MDSQRVNAYLQIACNCLDFDIGEVWCYRIDGPEIGVRKGGKGTQSKTMRYVQLYTDPSFAAAHPKVLTPKTEPNVDDLDEHRFSPMVCDALKTTNGRQLLWATTKHRGGLLRRTDLKLHTAVAVPFCSIGYDVCILVLYACRIMESFSYAHRVFADLAQAVAGRVGGALPVSVTSPLATALEPPIDPISGEGGEVCEDRARKLMEAGEDRRAINQVLRRNPDLRLKLITLDSSGISHKEALLEGPTAIAHTGKKRPASPSPVDVSDFLCLDWRDAVEKIDDVADDVVAYTRNVLLDPSPPPSPKLERMDVKRSPYSTTRDIKDCLTYTVESESLDCKENGDLVNFLECPVDEEQAREVSVYPFVPMASPMMPTQDPVDLADSFMEPIVSPVKRPVPKTLNAFMDSLEVVSEARSCMMEKAQTRIDEFMRNFLEITMFETADCWFVLKTGGSKPKQIKYGFSVVSSAVQSNWAECSKKVSPLMIGQDLPGRVIEAQTTLWERSVHRNPKPLQFLEANPRSATAKALGLVTALGIPVTSTCGWEVVVCFYSTASAAKSPRMIGLADNMIQCIFGNVSSRSRSCVCHPDSPQVEVRSVSCDLDLDAMTSDGNLTQELETLQSNPQSRPMQPIIAVCSLDDSPSVLNYSDQSGTAQNGGQGTGMNGQSGGGGGGPSGNMNPSFDGGGDGPPPPGGGFSSDESDEGAMSTSRRMFLQPSLPDSPPPDWSRQSIVVSALRALMVVDNAHPASRPERERESHEYADTSWSRSWSRQHSTPASGGVGALVTLEDLEAVTSGQHRPVSHLVDPMQPIQTADPLEALATAASDVDDLESCGIQPVGGGAVGLMPLQPQPVHGFPPSPRSQSTFAPHPDFTMNMYSPPAPPLGESNEALHSGPHSGTHIPSVPPLAQHNPWLSCPPPSMLLPRNLHHHVGGAPLAHSAIHPINGGGGPGAPVSSVGQNRLGSGMNPGMSVIHEKRMAPLSRVGGSSGLSMGRSAANDCMVNMRSRGGSVEDPLLGEGMPGTGILPGDDLAGKGGAGEKRRKPSEPPKCCRMAGCDVKAGRRSPYCISHMGSQRRCSFAGCNKCAQGSTSRCIAHGGGRRCTHPGCTRGARDRYFCAAHGGGRRCETDECFKAAVGGSKFCTNHGGGKRCQVDGCEKSAQSSTSFCVRHGGGRKCVVDNCDKVARGRTKHCAAHGGGVRCKAPECNKAAVGRQQLCRSHSGTEFPKKRKQTSAMQLAD
uniref:WRKY19-like zinc finger domain-containing protein n=1 Tax=Octactis speculum TaxID=3111310 RepID=A0A7S2E348_9STRA